MSQIRAILAAVRREQPLAVPALVAFALVVSVLEGLGVTLLVPLLQALDTGAEASSGAEGLVFDLFARLGIPPTVEAMLVVVFAIVVAQAAMTLLFNRSMFSSVTRFEARQRTELLERMLGAKWEFFLSTKIGRTVTSLTVDATQAGDAFFYLVQLFAATLTVVVYASVALWISWQMTLLVLVGLGGLALALRGIIARSADYGRQVTEANAEVQSDAFEELSAAKLLKSTATEPAALRRFTLEVDTLARAKYLNGMNTALVRALFDPLSVGLLCVGIYLAVTRFSVPLAAIIVFLFMFYRIAPRITAMQTYLQGVLSFAPALERIRDLGEEALRLAERTGGEPVAERLHSGVRLEGVDFSHGDTPIVTDVSIDVPAGAFVGLVGPSGAGKSTLADLVLGLIEPAAGRVLVDGHDLASTDLESWRSRVGYVAQESVLFHTTIAENLRLAAPEADDERLRAALTAASAEFVYELPDGIDTVVGDRGARLSGGQRQRIALARALVAEPTLLVLDEATSALDAESDERIQAAVDALAGSVTVIFVTHRLASVRAAQRIYYLEGGRVLEQGSFEELSSAGGRFAHMVELQQRSSSLDTPSEHA